MNKSNAVEKIENILKPTKEQNDSIDFLVNAIKDKVKVVAFIAPGGTGKTFTMKYLATDSRLKGISITMTATTNKAVTVMKSEGMKSAKTLHSAISKHVPTKMFKELTEMFKVYKKQKSYEHDFSPLVSNFLEEIGVKEKELFEFNNEKELLAENNVDSYDDRVFSHYSTLGYEGGVCSVDEGSMLPNKSTYQKDKDEEGHLKLKVIGRDILEKIFDTIIIVGDDSQLPPINGDSSFDGIPKTVLVENHRSEKGLLRLLDYVREGKNINNFIPNKDENVSVVASVNDDYFNRKDLIENKVTHIVYRNKTRFEITKRIRVDMSSTPILGEPIVYKGANIDDPGDSISKNEIGVMDKFMAVWENHTQVVNGRNFDEYGTGFTYLSYAYSITAHTAQGSSFDHVIIHYDDVPHFIDSETKRKWLYTACSRARKSITIIF